jgi:hypothetical protein
MKSKATEFITLLALIGSTHAHAERPGHSKVSDCGMATFSRPGVGSAFSGTVRNDDYAFSVQIPNGLVGWAGVDPPAPFHGFTIFLDPQMTTCIVFEVHIRVDEDDTSKPRRSAALMRLGEASAWQAIREGRVADADMTNISTVFSFEQSDQIDDGEVLLIAPTAKLPTAKRVYETFMRSLVFGRSTQRRP